MRTAHSFAVGARPLVCALFLAACVVLAEDAEPEIDGKPVSEWIGKLRSENKGFQLRAARALSKATPEQIPLLVGRLIPILESERENDRFVAAQTLGNYGAAARAAVPKLVPLLKGTQYERNRAAAAKALGQILKDAEPGEEVEEAALALAAKFNEDYDKYEDVRREAVHAVGMIGPAAGKCVPKLLRALTDYGRPGHLPDFRPVRREAAWACGRMGPLAAEHMDRLISMLQSEGEHIPEIAQAMGRIGALHENVVMNLLDKMEKSGGWGADPKSFEALEKFGAKALPARDFMMMILREAPKQRGATRALIRAARVLGAIGPGAADAAPLLEKMTTYRTPENEKAPQELDDELHEAAAKAYKSVTGKDAAAESTDH